VKFVPKSIVRVTMLFHNLRNEKLIHSVEFLKSINFGVPSSREPKVIDPFLEFNLQLLFKNLLAFPFNCFLHIPDLTLHFLKKLKLKRNDCTDYVFMRISGALGKLSHKLRTRGSRGALASTSTTDGISQCESGGFHGGNIKGIGASCNPETPPEATIHESR
jgi:hypothetical protein